MSFQKRFRQSQFRNGLCINDFKCFLASLSLNCSYHRIIFLSILTLMIVFSDYFPSTTILVAEHFIFDEMASAIFSFWIYYSWSKVFLVTFFPIKIFPCVSMLCTVFFLDRKNDFCFCINPTIERIENNYCSAVVLLFRATQLLHEPFWCNFLLLRTQKIRAIFR